VEKTKTFLYSFIQPKNRCFPIIGPKKITKAEKRQVLRSAKKLESLLDGLYSDSKKICQDQASLTDEYEKRITAYLKKEDIEDRTSLVKERFQFSTDTPELDFELITCIGTNTVSEVREYNKRPWTTNQQIELCFLQREYESKCQQLASLADSIMIQKDEQYYELLELTMLEEPYAQDERYSVVMLFLKDETRSVPYYVDLKKGICKKLEGPLDHQLDNNKLSKLKEQMSSPGVEANIYIMRPASKILRESDVLDYVISELMHQHIASQASKSAHTTGGVNDGCNLLHTHQKIAPLDLADYTIYKPSTGEVFGPGNAVGLTEDRLNELFSRQLRLSKYLSAKVKKLEFNN